MSTQIKIKLLTVLWPLCSDVVFRKETSEFISPWTSIHQAFFFRSWSIILIWRNGMCDCQEFCLLDHTSVLDLTDSTHYFGLWLMRECRSNSHPSANQSYLFWFLNLNSVVIGEFGIPCCETTSSAVIPLWRLSVCDLFMLVSLWLLLVRPKD